MKYTLDQLKETIVPMILSAGDEAQANAAADQIIKLVEQNTEVEHATA